MRAILSHVFLRNRASSANLTIVLMIVHLSCVYTILFLLSRPQYQLITPCVLTAYGECAENFSSFSLNVPFHSSLANSLYHNFTMLNNPDFLASNFLASNFSKVEELSRLAILSPTIIVYYNFPRPTIQINRCQDFQLISSSLKNGTTRQTRFQNNHPRIIGEIKISFMWKLFSDHDRDSMKGKI